MIKLNMKLPLLLMGLSGFGGAAMAAESTTYTFDDWQVTCQQAKDHSNHCAMSQRGIDQKSGRQIYQVVISFPKKKAQSQLDVLLPLGVLLRAGVSIEVKKNADSPFNISYRYCIAAGCLAQISMNQKILNAFHHGQKADIRIQDQNKKEIALPLSLKGYTKAFNKLNAHVKQFSKGSRGI